MKKFLIYILALIPILFGCNEKDKIVPPTSTGNLNSTGDTLYIQIDQNHPWSGFNNPQAILIGKEPFIYVCDTDNDRIVMLNTAGAVLGTKSIKRPIAIAQDYRLNLIVCAQLDTVLNGVPRTLSAVYKIDLFAVNHIIENASLKLLLPRSTDIDFHSNSQYTAVAAFFDNSFYIARTGPNNTSIFDPDNSILQFQPKADRSDSLVGRVHDIDPLSTGLISANNINCMTTFNRKNIDFIATLGSESAFKAQWFHHYQTDASEGYTSQFDPRQGMKFAQPNRFGHPTGSCLDPSGNIFVSDATKDSVFKFSSFGDELQSFGGLPLFKHPQGVAFFDRTLYVLDAEKNQILRFILSTDIGQ